MARRPQSPWFRPAICLHVDARLLAQYGAGSNPIELTVETPATDLEIQFDPQGNPFGIRRDRTREAEALAILEGLGLTQTGSGYLAEGLGGPGVLVAGVNRLPSGWTKQLPASLVGLKVRAQSVHPNLTIRRAASGWFEVDLKLLSEGVEVEYSELDREVWGDFITLRDGSVAPVDAAAIDPVLTALGDLRGLLPQGRGQIPPWLAGPLAELVKAVGPGAEIDGAADRLLNGIDR